MKVKPYKFNPIKELGLDIPKENRASALEAAANYIKEAMLDYIGEGKSPVSGGEWKRSLSKEYKKIKAEQSSAGFANLELTGELLDSLSVEPDGSKITIELPEDQLGKAEGHLTGIYGAGEQTPKPRQFMPQPGDKFKRDILQGLKDVLKEYED